MGKVIEFPVSRPVVSVTIKTDVLYIDQHVALYKITIGDTVSYNMIEMKDL